jgi:hypothetical protein
MACLGYVVVNSVRTEDSRDNDNDDDDDDTNNNYNNNNRNVIMKESRIF